jgi:hypothetical protein
LLRKASAITSPRGPPAMWLAFVDSLTVRHQVTLPKKTDTRLFMLSLATATCCLDQICDAVACTTVWSLASASVDFPIDCLPRYAALQPGPSYF